MHIPKLLECTTVYEEVLATVGCNTTNKKKRSLTTKRCTSKERKNEKKKRRIQMFMANVFPVKVNQNLLLLLVVDDAK